MTNLNTLPGFSTGGGGGSAAAGLISAAVGTVTLDNNRPTAECHPYTTGIIAGQCATAGNLKSRNVFARWMQWYDRTNNHTGFTINSFSIDRATGALTQLQGGPQDLWVNTSGAALSTTYCVYDPMHGNFFSAGNNAYPGYGTHVMGYTAGQITTTGAVGSGQATYSGGDHVANGTYCAALPQGSGTHYFSSAGYMSSYAGGRLLQGAANGITIPSFVNDSNWTSSTGLYQCFYQPDVNTTPSGHVTSCRGTSFTSPNYGRVEFRGSNSQNISPTPAGYSPGMLMCGHGGTTLLGWNNYFGTPGVTTPSFTSLDDGTRDVEPNNFMNGNGYRQNIVGIGNNLYLHFGPQVPDNDVELLKVNSNQDITQAGVFSLNSGTRSVLDPVTNYTHNFVVYETDSSPWPKWLVRAGSSENDVLTVNSYELTPDFSTY